MRSSSESSQIIPDHPKIRGSTGPSNRDGVVCRQLASLLERTRPCDPKGSAMQLPRPCLTCQKPTEPGQSRCPECLRIVRRKWDEPSRLRRQQRIKGGGAARRLRYKINKVGFADCQVCGNTFSSQLIEVDHIHPVALGGSDADDENVRPLCLQCHSLRPIPRPGAN